MNELSFLQPQNTPKHVKSDRLLGIYIENSLFQLCVMIFVYFELLLIFNTTKDFKGYTVMCNYNQLISNMEIFTSFTPFPSSVS